MRRLILAIVFVCWFAWPARAQLNISGNPPLPVTHGGTANSAAGDDQVLVGNGSTLQLKTLSDCQGAGKAVTYTVSSNSWGCNTIASGAGNLVEVSIDLGASGGTVYTTTVTGQSWVTTSSVITCSPFATSADGQTVETYFAAHFTVAPSNRVAGTGFDLTVFSPHGATGTFRVHCSGA